MFSKSLGLVLSATLALSCSAWQPTAQGSPATRLSAFASTSVGRNCASQRFSPAICCSRMVATGSSNDASPAGSAQSYMSRIPPHLQGLAIRKQPQKTEDYGTTTEEKTEAEKLAAIQAELDGEDEEEELDHVDYAMMMVDELDKAPKMRSFDLNIEDAEVLRSLRNKMNNDDFKHVFGRGVGELL